MSRQYFQNITEVPELIPDLANLVSEYTGGYCDSKTQGGTTCWSDHQECDQYCLGNLKDWLKPKFIALLGKPLTSKSDGEILERYSNLLGTVDYLRFPPLLYNDWNTILQFDINHPTIGKFSLLFMIETTKSDSTYRKLLDIHCKGSKGDLFLPPLVRNFSSKMNTKHKNYTCQYNDKSKWEMLEQNILEIYQDFEDLLYSNNTIPIRISCAFETTCEFEENYTYDENDRFIDFRRRAINYLFHSPKE